MARRRLTVGLVLAGLLVLAVGVYAGTRLPWGAKTARAVHGTAMIHDARSGLASFESDAHEDAAFDARHVWWTSDSRAGSGNPPCLRVGRSLPVEAGLMSVRHPDGGSHVELVWLRCP